MARLPRSRRTLVGTAVGVAVLVVLASLVGAIADAPGVTPTDRPEYDVDALVPDRAPSTGEVGVPRTDGAGTVVIDSAHVNRFENEDLEPLVAALSATGARVEFLGPREDLDDTLDRADAYVVIDPGLTYDQTEVDHVEDFVEDGGRLLLVGEPSRTRLQQVGLFGALVPARNRLGPIATRFGIQFGEGYLFNMETNDGNHVNIYADAARGTGLAAGVDRTALYTATHVSSRDGSPVLLAVAGTRNARTDIPGEYPVAVRDGNVLAIGDGTFLHRGNYNVVDNERFVRNVAGFLVNADRRHPLRSYPGMLGEEPRVRFTDQELTDAAQTLAADLRDRGMDPRLTLSRGGFAESRTDVLVTTFDDLGTRGVTGTGVDVRGNRFAVNGYSSDAEGVIVMRAPGSGMDLVVVVDDPERGDRAVSVLTGDELSQYLITSRTAVVRTAAADPGDENGDADDGSPVDE